MPANVRHLTARHCKRNSLAGIGSTAVKSERCRDGDALPALWRALQFIEEPGPGKFPVAHDALRRDLQNIGGLLDTQAAEKTQLNHLFLVRIELP